MRWWNRLHRVGNVIMGWLPPDEYEVQSAKDDGYLVGDQYIVQNVEANVLATLHITAVSQ